MLVDNKSKAVELIAESLLWGDIKLTESETTWRFDKDEEKVFRKDIEQWVVLRKDKSDTKEFREYEDKIFQRFLDFRVVNLVKGNLYDRDHEQKMEELKNDNLQLAKELGSAYIPPKDNKIGTV